MQSSNALTPALSPVLYFSDRVPVQPTHTVDIDGARRRPETLAGDRALSGERPLEDPFEPARPVQDPFEPRTDASRSENRSDRERRQRAMVEQKLHESEQKVISFLESNKNSLQSFFAEIGERHQMYLSDISHMYKILSADVKSLTELKYEMAGFVCPSALAIVDAKQETLNLTPTPEKLAIGCGSSDRSGSIGGTSGTSISGRGATGSLALCAHCGKVCTSARRQCDECLFAGGVQPLPMELPGAREKDKASSCSSAQDTDCREWALTESSFKDSLFMAMAPLYTVKDQFKAAMGPLQDAVKKLGADLNDLKLQQRGLTSPGQLSDSISPQQAGISSMASADLRGYGGSESTVSVSLQPHHYDDHTCKNFEFLEGMIMDTLGAAADQYYSAEEEEDVETMAVKAGALQRSKSGRDSHLNFASDLMGSSGRGLLERMAVLRIPGKEKKKQLFRRTMEPERNSCLAHFIHSQGFERIISIAIILNIGFITYSADYAVTNPMAQSTVFIRIAQYSFQLFYIVELILKLLVHRYYFFIGAEWHWNTLDFALGCTAVYDLTAAIMAADWTSDNSKDSGINLTFLRVLRLARLSKVMRVFRVVRFVSELNVLLKVISSSLVPLCWCMAMLSVFFYIFAIIFVHATIQYLSDSNNDFSHRDDVVKHWGSVRRAMISLYKATTGGQDWGELSDTIWETGEVYYFFFLFFITFIILALLNILTGIFVDRAMKATAEDKDGMAIMQLGHEREAVADLCRLHCVMTGKEVEDQVNLTMEQFELHMAAPEMRARFSVLGLEIWNTEEFYKLLVPLGDSDEVDLRTFVHGCMQMRGQSTRLGVQSLMSKVNTLTQLINHRLPRNHHHGHQHHNVAPPQCQSQSMSPKDIYNGFISEATASA